MRRLLLATMLAGVLSFGATAVRAQDHDQEHNRDHAKSGKTYYDRAHKDKHEWNENENTAWSSYRNEHHVKQSDFDKANRSQQQSYWNWRHEHPDSH